MIKRKHWNLKKILASDRAKAALVAVAESETIRAITIYHNCKFNYQYMHFFLRDAIQMGLVSHPRYGVYAPTQKLKNFLQVNRVRFSGGFNGSKKDGLSNVGIVGNAVV